MGGGRQRILFCRKLGQQVFIIVLDSPMWFAFRNELSWHCVWLISSSQKAGLRHLSIHYNFPKLKSREYLAIETQAIVSFLDSLSELSGVPQEHRMKSNIFWRERTIGVESFQLLKRFRITEVFIVFRPYPLIIVLLVCTIVWFLFGRGQIAIFCPAEVILE